MLDVVATTVDLPEKQLTRGHVGTIVEELSPQVMLVEFADLNGVSYAITPVPVSKLMELNHAPAQAA